MILYNDSWFSQFPHFEAEALVLLFQIILPYFFMLSVVIQFRLLMLKILKVELRALNKKHYSNISIRVLEARDKLCFVQQLLLVNPFDIALQQEEKNLLMCYADIIFADENFF